MVGLAIDIAGLNFGCGCYIIFNSQEKKAKERGSTIRNKLNIIHNDINQN